MPLSYAHTLGDGTTRNFDVPCEYLSRAHITVRVDGIDVPFTWIDTYRIQTTTAPGPNTVVEVRRTTPRVDRLVTFSDGSTLVQTDLNTSTLQSFFLAQEAFDQGAASMGVTEDGQFTALQRRITGLADPVNNQDAVNKRWAETAMSSQLVQATQQANSAATSAATALAEKNQTQLDRAATAADRVQTGLDRAAAASSAAAALAEKNQTQLDRAATAADRVQTGQDRVAAGGFAAAAAASAQEAALFDPASYFTRTEADGRFARANVAYTKAEADDLFPTKTAMDNSLANYASTTALNNGLNGRLSTNGGTLKGGLYVAPAGNAFIELRSGAGEAYIDFTNNGETRDYHWRTISRNDGHFQIVHANGGNVTFSADGNIATSAFGWLSNKFADRGAQVQHNSGVWEMGWVATQQSQKTLDCPAPWVLVGLRGQGDLLFLRAVWLRNN